jgi:hypothetical protein
MMLAIVTTGDSDDRQIRGEAAWGKYRIVIGITMGLFSVHTKNHQNDNVSALKPQSHPSTAHLARQPKTSQKKGLGISRLVDAQSR